MADYGRRLKRLAAEAFTADGRETWLRQLRSATLLEGIRRADTARPVFTFDPIHVVQAADLVRLIELTRSPRERRADPGQLPTIAQAYTDLAASLTAGTPRRVELLAMAASTWSLGGFQANATKLAADYLAEIDTAAGMAPLQVADPGAAAPAAIAVLVGVILRRDIDGTARLGALAELAAPDMGVRLIEAAGMEPLDAADAAVLAAYGLLGRAARALARFWLRGTLTSGTSAITDLQLAARLLLHANVVDTWTLLDNLAHVVEDAVATSPWRLLRRAPSYNRLWDRYLRARALGEHPVVQVWPSQRQVLDCGLLDRDRRSLTVTMPTSAGKTHLAEWAILDALAAPASIWDADRLAVYVVPSRALAAQVERHLTASLDPVGLRVSGLFGGSEHVAYEQHLIADTDVLVVTSEKFDLLLRNDPSLPRRLALVVTDEGHLIGERDRGLRLELVLTRVRRMAPNARMLVLSAVLPNADDIASWLDSADPRLAAVGWSPSQLNIGVFSWKGKEVDGQQGFVEYRSTDADHDFFLPYVLTRHVRKTRVFPRETKDVAAHLTLHYEQLGPVLIAAPKKRSTATIARAVINTAAKAGVVFGADATGQPPQEVVEQRVHVMGVVGEYAGLDHELVQMVAAGVGYHHADVPEQIRQALERAYRGGAIRVLVATSTLGQGVNLPAKTVIVAGTMRGQNDQLPVRDFYNLAGRAARPFQETEGHVILVAKSQAEARRLHHRYVNDPKLEPVQSTVVDLYVNLVRARMPQIRQGSEVPDDLELHDPQSGTEAVGWADALDLQLLSMLAEEVVDTPDEALLIEAVATVLGGTLAATQLRASNTTMAPLTRYAAQRVRAVATRVPDPALRQAFLRTGLSMSGCDTALAGARAIAAAVQADPALLAEERWSELRALLLQAAVQVTEIHRACTEEKIPSTLLAIIAADWIDGLPIRDIRHRHIAALGGIDPMRFAKILDRLVVHDLTWALSAMVNLWEHLAHEPLPSHITACAAMTKYGVNSEPACYAASIGVRVRHDAIALGDAYPGEPETGFRHFLRWATSLSPIGLPTTVSPKTAAIFLDRAASLLTPRAALNIAITESGTITVPLRGIGPMGTSGLLRTAAPGDPLILHREHQNVIDPQAIAVYLINSTKLAYLPREIARILAPLLDLSEGPRATATLSVLPDDPALWTRHDIIHTTIQLTPA